MADQTPPSSNAARVDRTALAMLAGWMSDRYYRTFRLADDADRGPFDAVLGQRDLRAGVTVGVLWEDDATDPARATIEAFEATVSSDLARARDDGAYALWLPPRSVLPTEEPEASDFRLLITRGLSGLAAGDRREVRVPALLRLAKVDAAGAYMSVVGGLAPDWTLLSENIGGSYHLDSRAIHRTPEETAERDILLAHVRDRAALLMPGEMTTVDSHDYWLVSRLPGADPAGLTVVGAPSAFDSADAAAVRRLLRAHITRAEAQRTSGGADLSVLVLVGSYAHITDERVTAGLRGMNPALYSGIDLVVLVADGQVRQVLQPRSLPWER
ncbi:MAG: hypothetical protein WC211_07710 [Dehalococcoidia bacterium]